ncbi:hypothetical protein Q7P36_002169 [Cladosporium allicinum]
MAGQGWSFDALDHGLDYQQNGLDDRNNYDHNYDDTYDNDYDHVQGATWADLEDAYELGEHWSSDTWNGPDTEHVADHNTAPAQPQYTSQHTPQHTSHTRAPPSSPPRHMNDGGHRPTNTHHAPAPYSRPDALPAAQSETTYRRASRDLASPYRPATFTDLPPQNPPSRSGIESFLRRPNQEEEARNNALNQSILDTNSQVIDSDSDDEDMPPRQRQAANTAANTVDLTQSPNISTTQQSRTRKRESSSEGGSAKKRIKQVVVDDDDDVFEDEAPSAEAELLQAQQADALKMQNTNKEDAVVKIGKRNCIICLENYTNATTAACGHIFCHECLSRALMASEKNNDRSGKGNCPACRKVINRKSAKEVIPIAFLKKSAFKTKGRQAHNK